MFPGGLDSSVSDKGGSWTLRKTVRLALSPTADFVAVAPGRPDRPRAHWSVAVFDFGVFAEPNRRAHRFRSVGVPGNRHWPARAFFARVGLHRRVILQAVYRPYFAKGTKDGVPLGQALPALSNL